MILGAANEKVCGRPVDPALRLAVGVDCETELELEATGGSGACCEGGDLAVVGRGVESERLSGIPVDAAAIDVALAVRD